jgi:prepilin-type N-terminal cleavage/methylation domain-containing protein
MWYTLSEGGVCKMGLKRSGFTFLEIMMVSAVIGIVAVVAVPNYLRAKTTAIETTCRVNAKQLQTALTTADLSSAAGIPMNDLLEDEIKAVVYPNFVRSMPRCSIGSYFTDANGNVMCSTHNSADALAAGHPLSDGEITPLP